MPSVSLLIPLLPSDGQPGAEACRQVLFNFRFADHYRALADAGYRLASASVCYRLTRFCIWVG